MTSTDWEALLGLPPHRTTSAKYPYGASEEAARYCRLGKTPLFGRGHWHHGWYGSNWYGDPLLIAEVPLEDDPRGERWVARADQESLLRDAGYTHARAIGLPIVYCDFGRVERRPNSLLVMPAHTLDYVTATWKFDEYVEQIDAISGDFDEVVVCVHPSCVKKGYWIKEFSAKGYPVVLGAGLHDANALKRICRLMSSFEFVTTNQSGSQVAYGAYLGARVSIYGSYAEKEKRHARNSIYYQRHPQLLDPAIRAVSRACVQEHYPFLFCHPAEAEERREWGGFEVGDAHRLPPGELRQLLGWGPLARRVGPAARRHLASRVYRALPPRERRWVGYLRKHGLGPERELRRIRRLPERQPGVTELTGAPLRFVDGPTFAYTYRAIFSQECYRFVTEQPRPRILDLGANVGLASIYLKRRYPEARVTAFEADPEIAGVLRENLASHAMDDVEVVAAAVWDSDGELHFQADGADAGRVVPTGEGVAGTPSASPGSRAVPTLRLRPYLEAEEHVAFLKVDIEGAEGRVLRDVADLLERVEHIFVEYHSPVHEEQDLRSVIDILDDAGFRLHLQAPEHSGQPLYLREVFHGMDLMVNIYGFRT